MKLKGIKEFVYNNSRGYSLLPFFLGLSIGNTCNRRCKFCLYHSPKLRDSDLLTWLDKQPDFMDVDKFELFISNLGWMRYSISSVGLTAKGEPMLHPDFFKFCEIMDKHKIKFSVTTNGDYLYEQEIERFNAFKYLTSIRVSVYEEKTYNRLKHVPLVMFYNMTDKHLDGTIDGVKLWADGLTTNTVQKDFNKIKSCKKPFSYLTLNPDGSVTPCNSWYELGNAFKTSLFKMWNSKKLRDYRVCALDMCNVPESDCLNCGFNL